MITSVTSVGATQNISPEIAADFSSGGFSNLFARPSYQDDAVSAYLQTLGDTNAGLFNTTGRAVDLCISGPVRAAPSKFVIDGALLAPTAFAGGIWI